MDLVVADGPLLEEILDATHPLWSDGLSRRAYARYNEGQTRTTWGSRRLRRFALVDEKGHLLSSAKRYDIEVRLDGRTVAAIGIAAVFTPDSRRGQGYAPALINRMLAAACHDGAELAFLFSEIGTSYYRRLGFVPVPRTDLTLSVLSRPGAPMVLVRAAEDRDVPAVTQLAASMAKPYRFALVPTADSIRYSLAKKRLLAGFSTPGALTVEFFIVEEGAGAVAFAILTTAGEDDVVLEMCGDRDPSGARVGALLQVLRAREPAQRPALIHGSLPAGWLPPQLRIERSEPSPSVLMVRELKEGLLRQPLRQDDVLYWHGDLF